MLSYPVPDEVLAGTINWLQRPREWDSNKGDPVISDKKLARLQFAASLAEAYDARAVSADILIEAAESLLPHQEKDGSWAVMKEAGLGSPATYGPVLSTSIARRILAKAGETRFSGQIRRADAWLMEVKYESIVDAAAIVLALSGSPGTESKVRQVRDFILAAQTSDGGWGPFPRRPAEAFDTAIAILALEPFRAEPAVAAGIRRGRAFLTSIQYADGGWPETTRPSGGSSYAQHISTSAWATIALLRTR
ncbi:MAG: terpene cyclase/mutase family protein [Acidobacteria bacterium]|nr:terpene cyclase/mutase family protein [Acidobacteriota bacterium]